jgi:hypothetical protein
VISKFPTIGEVTCELQVHSSPESWRCTDDLPPFGADPAEYLNSRIIDFHVFMSVDHSRHKRNYVNGDC